MSGYSTAELSKRVLGELRVGLSAANPAGVVALVRRIDELEAQLKKAQETKP